MKNQKNKKMKDMKNIFVEELKLIEEKLKEKK